MRKTIIISVSFALALLILSTILIAEGFYRQEDYEIGIWHSEYGGGWATHNFENNSFNIRVYEPYSNQWTVAWLVTTNKYHWGKGETIRIDMFPDPSCQEQWFYIRSHYTTTLDPISNADGSTTHPVMFVKIYQSLDVGVHGVKIREGQDLYTVWESYDSQYDAGTWELYLYEDEDGWEYIDIFFIPWGNQTGAHRVVHYFAYEFYNYWGITYGCQGYIYMGGSQCGSANSGWRHFANVLIGKRLY